MTKSEIISLVTEYIYQHEMSDGERETYELVDKKGYTYKQAAEQLNISESNVSNKLKRARKKVKALSPQLLSLVYAAVPKSESGGFRGVF